MPTIKRLAFIGLEYAFAPEKAYGMSRGGGFRRHNGLVEIETDSGVRGIGEAFGNPLVTREYFRMVEPLFVGRSVFDFDHVEARLRNAMYHLGVGNQLTACLGAINVALFDAMARGFGVRVCDLIGGCGVTRIPAYASTGFFSNDPGHQLDHMLAEAAGHPYAGAKIKIGRGIKDDLSRVRRAREALGPDKLLMVDINGAYTADVALECITAIAPYGIHWVEEPLPPGDLPGYAELRARSPVAIAAGEAHHTVRDFRALIDGRCVDIVQPSIPGTGGLG
jgi:D-galactarolactone cycloisomerase